MAVPDDVISTLRRLLETAQEPAVILWDENSVITGWLMGAEKVFGHSAEEAIGQPASILYTPEDRLQGIPEYEVAVALKRGFSENDRWMQKKDGSRFWANGVLNPVRAVDGSLIGFGKILRNRSDHKGKTDSLHNQIDSLKQANARSSLAITTLAHELRGPLSAIGHAVDVARETSSNDESLDMVLGIVERQCRSMSRLIADVLDAARAQHGKIRLRRTELSLAETVAAAVETCRGLARERHQVLQMILPSGPIRVYGDAPRLQQVVINLVHNASKFTPEGGNVWVKLSNEGREAVVRVEDNGSGISPEMLPRIFDLFAQCDHVDEVRDQGLGIGLALVKEIVELHGGTVQVRSDGPGKGSEFTMRLPMAH